MASFQDSVVAKFESSKVPEFKTTKVLGFQVSRVQGSKHQGRSQTCKGLVFVHQQRNDKRNAKQTQNTIELLQFVKNRVGSV